MTVKRVYKNTMPDTQYLFQNGKAAVFKHGRFETDEAVEISELDYQIKMGIPHIYIDPADMVVDTTKVDFVRQRQIEATAAAIKEYDERVAAGEVVETEIVDPETRANVAAIQAAQEAHEKEKAAAEAKLVKAAENTNAPDQKGTVVEVTQTPVKVNMAKVLSGGGANTGIASSANVASLSAQSAS